MSKDNTKGFQTFLNEIKAAGIQPFKYSIHDESGSLKVNRKPNPRYVQPIFSTVEQFGNGASSSEEARVILISAVGATGKSALAEEMSYRLQCPIVNLGEAEVMGGNSLTGIIYKKMSPADGASFVQELQAGNATMILDGLDEGFQRTKTQGYFDFLDDMIGMTATNGKSFILLGRTNAIELAALHLESRGVKTITYQIEPFTINQAKEFVRLIMKDEKGVDVYGKPYQDLLDYIITSIGGFFKDRHEAKHCQYERFIGYAPVLLSIAAFLEKNKNNFQRVLEDFRKNQLRGTSLVINIVEGIMKRDKELKILPQLIEPTIKDRSQDFKNKARTLAYNYDEQCARVLYRCLNRDYPYPVTGDEAFDFAYNQGISRWIDEHPLLAGNKIGNTVFEGYILARLISNSKYRGAVDEYISHGTGISYMFFSIYQELHKDDDFLDLSIVSYLYTSIKALDNKKKFYTLEMTYDETDADELTEAERQCNISFKGNEDSSLESFDFQVLISSKSVLPFHNYIGDVFIDVPINLNIYSSRIVLSAPGYINCKSIDIMADEIVLARRNQDCLFTIEADNLDLLVENNYPAIIGDADSKKYFSIVCDNNLPYPLNEYQTSPSQSCEKLTPKQRDYYLKMRRTLIMFRSHSKGEFAKVQSKIQNRIASKPEGKVVVDALLKSGVIYPSNRMYFINKEVMNEVLGLKFDSIRTCVINDKVTCFLKSLE